MEERISQPILLDSIGKVKDFVKQTSKFTGTVYVNSGRYIVDGKSLMGVFSLDLSKPVSVDYSDDDDDLVQETISQYFVEEL